MKQLYSLMTILNVTGKCDRHCANCYYPHSNMTMSLQMARDVGKWIASTCKDHDVKLYKTLFLGGEPFIALDRVRFLIDYLNEFLPYTTKGHSDGKFIVFTNGDRLDEVLLWILKKRHVRILLNPTYNNLEEIERRILKIKDVMGGCGLAVVADEVNLPRLPEVARLAVKHQATMRINRLYDGGWPGYIEEFKNQMHKVFDILLDSEWVMCPNYILESSYVTWDGPKNPNACGRWLVIIDPDGSIRSCNGDMSTKIGNIYSHKYEDLEFSHRWSAKGLDDCQTCEWVTVCQGGCPYVRKLSCGNYNTKTPFCEAYKTLWPRVMELKDKWLGTKHGQLLLQQ